MLDSVEKDVLERLTFEEKLERDNYTYNAQDVKQSIKSSFEQDLYERLSH